MEMGSDVKDAATTVSRTYRPKFETKIFEEDRPGLYQKFLVSSSTWYQRFSINTKFRKSMDPAD
jgi:hypothetical protein